MPYKVVAREIAQTSPRTVTEMYKGALERYRGIKYWRLSLIPKFSVVLVGELENDFH
jgi:hypothetical protein